MASTATTQFITASAWKTDGDQGPWQLLSFGTKPGAAELGQLRRSPTQHGRRVRVFTAQQWDALPIGQQDSDWVGHGPTATLRWADGVRAW